MGGRFDDYKHLIRLGLLFAAGIVLFLAIRAWAMPPDFGKYGHYRPGALDDIRQRPITFAGQKACVECHSDVAETRAPGRHARISCESCHGAQGQHAADPGAAAATKPDPRTVCLRCHVALRARPKTQPQIVVSDHAGDASCSECHKPHQPSVS